MPITAQAIKKLKHDRLVTRQNKIAEGKAVNLIKKFRKNPSKKLLSSVYQVLDKSVKIKIFHANKSTRLKSRLAKLLGKK